MSVVDWLIVAFAVLLAVHGYARGLIVGALSFIGFLVGAAIGTRVGPLLLAGGAESAYAPIFGLGGALLAGVVLASGLGGLASRLRAAMRIPVLRMFDGLLGALFTVGLALGMVWLLAAIAVQTAHSRQLRAALDTSAIIGELDRILPPSGPILNALAHFDPLPAMAGPAADVPAPERRIVDAGGVDAAGAGVVRVLGEACGLGVEGSGWVAAPGLVITNAHVIAGEDGDTVVEIGGRPPDLEAVPIVFDSHNDIAVLRVPGLQQPSLPIDPSPGAGLSAAILGYPLDGPFNRQPARLGDTRLTDTENAYGDGPVLRLISSLRGRVRPGNSGGPLIDAHGAVVGTVFASITNAPRGRPGGFAVPNSVVERDVAFALARLRAGRVSVGSGRCAD